MKSLPIKHQTQQVRRINIKRITSSLRTAGNTFDIAGCYLLASHWLKKCAFILASILLSTPLGIAASPLTPMPTAKLSPELWENYQQLYITPEGRVVDTGNKNISHSEGQGTGMLLANAYHDQETFQKLWHWTQQNLQIRKDKLFAWRWEPTKTPAVTDPNNASDGDILIAWALYRAAQQWNNAGYRHAAQQISRDIRTKLIRRTAQGLALLPGATGFEKNNGIVVNLSYWIFPAFNDFNRFDPAKEWGQLTQSGLKLIKAARFGRWNLPPDWLLLGHESRDKKGHKLSLPEQFEPHFGYNAIRIPLYLAWARHDKADIIMPFINFWTSSSNGSHHIAPTTNLLNNTVGSYEASPGFKAIIQLIYTSHNITTKVAVDEYAQQDYYSASLLLLSRLAATEKTFDF